MQLVSASTSCQEALPSLQVITATTSRQVLASSDYGRGIADQLRTQPENFFDMRQAKVSNRSPDFKHKFKKMQAVWLESSSKDIVQLVQQWDADSSNSQNRVCPLAHAYWLLLNSCCLTCLCLQLSCIKSFMDAECKANGDIAATVNMGQHTRPICHPFTSRNWSAPKFSQS